MKAIVQDRYGGLETLECKDIDRPAPRDDEVLVRVRAAGLDRGVWHLMAGLPYLIRFLGFGVRRPKVRVRGMDVAGTVEAVGAQVTRFQPGDEVFGWADGSYAEYASVPADKLGPQAGQPVTSSRRRPCPSPGSPPSRRSATPARSSRVSGCWSRGGRRGGRRTRSSWPRRSARNVTGVAGTTKLDLVRSLGADDAVDYTREDVTDGTRHWDLIIDTGGHRPLSRLRRALTPRGTLVIVGSEGRGRWLGGFDRNLRAVALSPFVGQRLGC